MLQSEIKLSFVELGNFLRQFSLEKNTKNAVPQLICGDFNIEKTKCKSSDLTPVILVSSAHRLRIKLVGNME